MQQSAQVGITMGGAGLKDGVFALPRMVMSYPISAP